MTFVFFCFVLQKKKKKGNCDEQVPSQQKTQSSDNSQKDTTQDMRCNTCNKTFTAQDDLTRHQCLEHDKKWPHMCKKIGCKQGFMHQSDLKQHVQSAHKCKESFYCLRCDKRFKERLQLVSHERLHMSEKVYRCDYCDQAFSQSSSLQYHKKSHISEKEFVCLNCNKYFSEKHSFQRHTKAKICFAKNNHNTQ
ncbi:hypothetical protein RFI_15482 [Reticulomyxa filosa]|uniref:C2H2-type domain-containing protein n=1 Tax=Reticulomyxa filosa TaxID=46433 RepID=X6N730_RETFI|nr:hypothetical protein RFI_15482 [Reticulomyxa filosa]|eukprot:ETO21723.1 hypothetical protein RFI_15482 [Reticulomyxa filosa]